MDVCANTRATADVNYQKLLTKIHLITNQWEKRDLTLWGKVQVCNTLILSQFWYKLQVLPTPSSTFLKTIKKMLRDFIWNKKIARISYAQLIQPLA